MFLIFCTSIVCFQGMDRVDFDAISIPEEPIFIPHDPDSDTESHYSYSSFSMADAISMSETTSFTSASIKSLKGNQLLVYIFRKSEIFKSHTFYFLVLAKIFRRIALEVPKQQKQCISTSNSQQSISNRRKIQTSAFPRGIITRDVEAVIFQTHPLPLPHLSLPLPLPPTKNEKTTVDNFF